MATFTPASVALARTFSEQVGISDSVSITVTRADGTVEAPRAPNPAQKFYAWLDNRTLIELVALYFSIVMFLEQSAADPHIALFALIAALPVLGLVFIAMRRKQK